MTPPPLPATLTLAMLLACPSAILAAEQEVLVWRGCGISKTAFMDACARAYEKDTGIEVRLSGGGATLGIQAAAEGGADLGGTCRACLRSRDEDKLDVKVAIVAWDALAVIVHPDNPVKNITREQLRGVLQQKITRWSQLGGDDTEIVVVARRGKTSGVGYSTRLLILEDQDADYGPTVIRLASSGPVEKLVERQPRAIAVTGVSSARKRDLKILSIDGHQPSVENIIKGVYPYFRPLYIAYKPKDNPQADRFVSWLLSDRGQAIIQAQGTVTLAQGIGLVTRYRHYENTRQIVNFQALLDLAHKASKK